MRVASTRRCAIDLALWCCAGGLWSDCRPPHAREWWLDAATSTLYFMANGTTDAPAATGWVGSHLETVLHVAGTQAAPVAGHKLVGVHVMHTAPIFLKTYMASLSVCPLASLVH